MSYDILQIAEIDLGELGDIIQVDLDRSRKVLRISLFKDEPGPWLLTGVGVPEHPEGAGNVPGGDTPGLTKKGGSNGSE